MQTIAASQLQSYFAVIYGLTTLDRMIENKPPSESDKYLKFEQILKWSNGTEIVEYLPRMLAPVSCINFWIKQLHLSDNTFITEYKHLGYCSVHHIMAEMIGYYKFYTRER